jgi:hypothetical protein
VIDQQPEIRSDQKLGAMRRRWTQLMKVIQPIACVLCGILLITDRAPRSTIHAAAPQVSTGSTNRGQKKDDNEEWTDVQEWMQNNCINQWKFYNDKLADRPAAQQRARKLMIEQYRNVTGTRNPQMRDALTDEARVRDNIFGVVLGYRRHDVNRPKAQKLIEAQADDLAKVEIAIRVARINELKAEINDLQQKQKEYATQVATRELKQADLPAGRLSATGDAAVLQETTNPPTTKSGSTTRPASK